MSQLASRAAVAVEWTFFLLLLVVIVDALVSILRRRRSSMSIADFVDVGVSSTSQFTVRRLQLLLDARTTTSGKRVRVRTFVLSERYDIVFVDLNSPGREVPASGDCLGIVDGAVSSTAHFQCRQVIPLSSRKDLLEAVGPLAPERPTAVVKVVYGILILMAFGLIAVIAYGFIKGL